MIEVTNKNKPEAPKIILKPKEKLVFSKTANAVADSVAKRKAGIVSAPEIATAISIMKLPQNVADTSFIETSWVYNRLIFEGETFSEVATKMERWYNIRINFRNKKLADYRLSGSFDNESIGEALQALRYIAPFNYKIDNNEVEITD
jgi:ferric-dicitrate binding protein FerR (iron transport regulator)